MTDIPVRLRDDFLRGEITVWNLLPEAANEIERLRFDYAVLDQQFREATKLTQITMNDAAIRAATIEECDIVERLRQGIERGDEGDAEAAMDKAADEIERLTVHGMTYRGERDEWKAYCEAADAEIERLQTEFDKATCLVSQAIHQGEAMSDIVERLRTPRGSTQELVHERLEAADEIERLQREYAELENEAQRDCQALEAELGRITAERNSIRAATIEECAKHLEDQADLMTDSLHCGDNSSIIATTHRTAVDFCEAAKRIRALKEQQK